MPHHEHDRRRREDQHIAADEPAQIGECEKECPLATVEMVPRLHVHPGSPLRSGAPPGLAERIIVLSTLDRGRARPAPLSFEG